MLACRTHPTEVRPEMPGRVSRGRRDRGRAGGRTPRRPGCPSSHGRAASITDLLAFAVLPAVTGVRQGAVLRQIGIPLLESLTVPVSATVDAGLPRRALCLAAGQDRQATGCRSEACALATRWRLIACLTPRTALRGHGVDKQGDGPLTGKPHTGVYPPLPSGSRAITRGSTRVEGPRYQADGAAALVGGWDRRVAPQVRHLVGWKVVPCSSLARYTCSPVRFPTIWR
jgi:hypothetical protein